METTTEQLHPRPGWANADAHITVTGPTTAADLGSLVVEQAALDRLLAVETVYRFAFSFGERNRGVLRDCFTHDAYFAANIGGDQPVGPYEGRDRVVEWLTSYWPRQTDQRRHFVTNAVVDDLNAKTATVTTMLTLAGSENGAMRLITAGFYRCQLRKGDDGAWRIAGFRAGYDAAY